MCAGRHGGYVTNAGWLLWLRSFGLTSFWEAVRFVQVFSYVQEHGSPARRHDAGRRVFARAPHRIRPRHRAPAAQNTTPTSRSQRLPPPPNGVSVNVNQNETLSAVRYDNKYEIYGGAGFSHFKSGPALAEGANLGR